MQYLVTGGSGSFGRAFTKYLLKEGRAERIVIYSRGEHAQAEMAREIDGNGICRFFIGDVRDRDRLRRAMSGIDVVVHAAALKRIEVGHYNPVEMVKTNVLGAINVIEAAQDAGVKKVVALSTDKAVEPISPYGCSKAMAESLFLAANNTVSSDGPRFSVVRYGNIFGSNGSVVPRWRQLIQSGERTVPITSPDCTRFMMHLEEAVILVQNTVDTMSGGEVSIPDLPAYRLGDLAEAMNVGTKVIGLPEWEKKDESMKSGFTSAMARRMDVDELREVLRAA